MDSTPKGGQTAGHGRQTGSKPGDTAQRLGTYNSEKISQATFAKMERHFQVRLGLALAYLPLLMAEWTVDGPDPVVSEFVTAALTPIWRQTVRSMARTGIARGCAPHEIVWERREGITLQVDAGETTLDGWVPSKIVDIDPSALGQILVDGNEDLAGYALTVPLQVTVPRDKTLHFANDMRFGNWWGESRLVGAYEPWYRQQLLWDYYLRYMERRGTPAAWVQFPPGADDNGETGESAAEAIATGITTDDVAIWTPAAPAGQPAWDVSYVEDSQRSQGFQEALEAHNRYILLGLLVPPMIVSQDGTTGAYAMSQTHADMYAFVEDALLGDIVTAINRQLVPRIVRYTFGNVPMPEVVTPGLSDETHGLLADVFKLAVQQGAAPLALGKIADALGIPVEDASASPEEEGPEKKAPETPEVEASDRGLRRVASEVRELIDRFRVSKAARGV